MGSIVLLTDFGSSYYVGQMKGVISKICPNSQVLDLSHSIEKYNITEAGFILFNSLQYFPDNSIFVCVVDPGVGSQRMSIIIETENITFIGPDNGLFSLILDNLKVNKVININNFSKFEFPISSTFHGRDVFAPVAALMMNGANARDFGEEIQNSELIRNKLFYPEIGNHKIIGSLLFADSFGNLITNIHKSYLENKILSIEFQSYQIKSIAKTFSDVEIGNIVAYIGSSSYLELAINQGHLKSQINSSSDMQVYIIIDKR